MSARISPCGQYRYDLRRTLGMFGGARGVVTFVMLNPSTADADHDDPTIRRCIGFAKRWEMSELVVVNLWPLRATKPAELFAHPDPDGPGGNPIWNEKAIADAVYESRVVVAAWGAHRDRMAQIGRSGPDVVGIAHDFGVPLRCLGYTKHGHPRHPLYVRGDAPLVLYPPEKAAGR